MSFLCIRHAQSEMNAEGRWQGQADSPLSDQGRRQAEALAPRLLPERLTALVSSDLLRARETAEIVAGHLTMAVHLEPGLREMDVGEWSGLPHRVIQERWPGQYARFRSGDPEVRPGGGESRRQLRERAVATFAALAERFAAERLGVVTHKGVLLSLIPGLQIQNAGTVWVDAAQLDPPDVRQGAQRL